jgi:hypothetical protein
MAVDANAPHQQFLAELRCVAALDLDKQDGVVRRQMMRFPGFVELVLVLLGVSRSGRLAMMLISRPRAAPSMN